MRRLLVADHDPHIGQAIRIWLKHHGVRVSAADGAVVDASTDVQAIDVQDIDVQGIEIQDNALERVKPSQTVTICRRRSNHRASEDDATGSGGAASVNQGRLPDVAGRRYTPQLE